MSTTNDPQAPYGKPTERAPMLSDEEILAMREKEYAMDNSDIRILQRGAYLDGALDTRRAIKARITSGELRVVKKAHNVWNGINPAFQCSECGHVSIPALDLGQFCQCGAEIVK